MRARRRTLAFVALVIVAAIVLFLGLLFVWGRAPASVSSCSIREDRRVTIATITIDNRSTKPIVRASVLIDTTRTQPRGGNRSFDFATKIAPGQTRRIDGVEPFQPIYGNTPLPSTLFRGHIADYSFKDSSNIATGCELEFLAFADGSHWELGDPL